MSTASAQVNAKYQVTGRDGTNLTLTRVGQNHPTDVQLPDTLTVAHGNNTTFWGTTTDGSFYVVGVDKVTQ